MPQKPFEASHVPKGRVKRFGPGQHAAPHEYEPGDFILAHGKSFFSGLIRIGQRLRFRGADRPFAWWSHAAIIVGPDGALIEALGPGVQRANLTKYQPTEYHLVSIAASVSGDDRREAVAFAEWCIGLEYGWLTIVSIALGLLMGGKFTFGFDGQAICSGLVARALERTRVIFNRTPSHIMPADLAKYFDVKPEPRAAVSDKGPIVA